MTKWEYKEDRHDTGHEYNDPEPPGYIEWLNKQGADGWEVVKANAPYEPTIMAPLCSHATITDPHNKGVSGWVPGTIRKFLFKRPVPTT